MRKSYQRTLLKTLTSSVPQNATFREATGMMWWSVYRRVLKKKRKLIKAYASYRCENQAVSAEAALTSLVGEDRGFDLESRFQKYMDSADRRVESADTKIGGAGNLHLLYGLSESINARYIVETGVAAGWSSLVILLSISQRPDSMLVSTDLPYPSAQNVDYVGSAVPCELRKYWRLIRDADRTALPQAIGLLPWLDMCHYDSDKSDAGRSWAYPLLWDSLRPGGFFVSDDVHDNLAFRRFCRRVGCIPTIVRDHGHHRWGDKYVGILRKPN